MAASNILPHAWHASMSANPNVETPILVLDAMGVIYRVGDDVPELLVPFIRQQGGCENAEEIENIYRAASLGEFSAAEFWRRVGVSPAGEDEYLARFELTPGIVEFLQRAAAHFRAIVCLSNDVSEWSLKLRRRFRLEGHFAAWYISGDLHLRKPDPQIYRNVVTDLKTPADRLVFVDDRLRNLDAAADLGFVTVYYQADSGEITQRHRTIRDLAELVDQH
jgi:putative hydrolase of the HAD superfamily